MAIYQGNKKVGYNIDTTVYSTCPIGTILSYGGSNIPSGYLLCDGSEISKETYKDLYEIIGDTYGTSTDNTKFKLPNLRDKFIQGANNNLGTNKDAGLPNITGEFYQDANAQTGVSGAFTYKSGGSLNLANSTTATSGAVAFDASKSNSIYGNSDTVQPPSVCLNFIIKALNVGESGSSSEVINDNATSKTTTYSSDKIDTTYVKKEEGKSLVENTEISKIHEHNNKAYLDKLGENESGKPTYNGEEIGNLSNCYNKTESEEKFAEKNHNHDTIYRKIEDSYSKTEIDDKGFLTEHQNISGKQDKLKVGDNITISDDNTISATEIDDTKSSTTSVYSSNKSDKTYESIANYNTDKGTTDISTIGDGTFTGAIGTLNTLVNNVATDEDIASLFS